MILRTKVIIPLKLELSCKNKPIPAFLSFNRNTRLNWVIFKHKVIIFKSQANDWIHFKLADYSTVYSLIQLNHVTKATIFILALTLRLGIKWVELPP